MKHSTQDDYEHFLAYSGLADAPLLRYAYFHGANADCEKPSALSAIGPLDLVDDEVAEAAFEEVLKRYINTNVAPNMLKIGFDEGWAAARAAVRSHVAPTLTCPTCKGSGTTRAMTQQHGPDDYEVEVTCSECHGTGAIMNDTAPPSSTVTLEAALARVAVLRGELDEAQEHARQADAESDHLRRRLTAVSAIESTDAKDAARYRWLRNNYNTTADQDVYVRVGGPHIEMDDAIDERMAATDGSTAL